MSESSNATAEIEAMREQLESLGGPVGLAAQLNEGVFEQSGLDLRTFFLVRAAALAAMGADPASWAVTTELMDGQVSADDLLGTLTAIAPVVGTARLLKATAALLES